MKKLIVSMNITLDGFLSDPHHDLSWHFSHWSADMENKLGTELTRADTILLGRLTYQAMARYWPMQHKSLLCLREDIPLADMMNGLRKVVYSNTLSTACWNNTEIIRGDIKTAISRLKRSGSNKHIIVYGSSQLVAALMQYKLIDEYQLWVHPVVLGKGHLLFRNVQQPFDLQLVNTTTFQSGVVLMDYQRI